MNMAQQQKVSADVGRVESITNEICTISGLHGVALNNVVELSSGQKGIVLGFNQEEVQAILLGDYHTVTKGELVRISARGLKVNTNDKLLGRVIDPLGTPLDDLGAVEMANGRYIESAAKPISQRAYVDRPLSTGFLTIDSQVPIGMGQRELLVGVKKVGKIDVAIETLCTQAKLGSGVLGIYVAIDADTSSIKRRIARLTATGALQNTIVIASRSSDPASLNYISPMVGVSVAEAFAVQGKDVVIIFDNLTSHAKVYRQISLLMGRPAGREAYPGDIFYLHARLLERCGAFSAAAGGGTITALPIVETQSDEITDYITTNLMSITDGHILFRQNLANKGISPAVDSGYSVSRIAGRAQATVMRELSDQFKRLMIQFSELEKYLAFGTDLQADAQQTIDLGNRAQDLCNQSLDDTYLPHQQIVLLYLLISQKVLYWDRPQLIMLRIQLFTFIERPEWKPKLVQATAAASLEEATPILKELIEAFTNHPDTLKPTEKKQASAAEKETIIDLLRETGGAANATGTTQE